MARFSIRNLRWYMAGLICLVTALNYLDRNTLALVLPWLEKDIGLTHEWYANIQSAFLIGHHFRVLQFQSILSAFAPDNAALDPDT